MARLKIGSLQHKRSSVVNDNTPKLPTAEQLVYGEIAINYAKDYETLSIKNSSGDVVTFSSDSIIYNNVDNKIGTVAEGNTVVGMIDDAKTAIEGKFNDGDARTLADLNTKIKTKTYSIATATTEGLGTNVRDAYKLVDEKGEQVGETIIKVYNDSALQSVSLVDTKPAEGEEGQDGYVPSKQGQFLMFDYLTTNNEHNIVYLDVSSFLAESEFADGLQVLDHIVSVKRDSTSEDFLTVGANGIKLSGVQDAINVEKTRAEGKEGELATSIAEVESNLSVETQTRTTEIERLENLIGNIEAGISDATEVKVSSGTSHIEIESGATDGKVTYTISEVDIASAAVLANEVTNRTQAISSEASAREAADQANADAIAAEKTRAESKEGELKTAIEAEKTRAESKEGELKTEIEDEKTRAQGAEAKALTDAKAYTDVLANGAVAKNATDIADEVTRAKAAEKANADAINELNNKKADVIDVTPLFEVNGTITGYTFEDLMASKLLYKDSNSSGVGTAVRYVGYGKKTSYSSSIAYLVIDSMVWDDNLRPHNSDAYAYVAQIQYGDGGSIITTKVSDFYNSDLYIFDMDRYMRAQSNSLTATTKFMFDELSYAISKNKVIIVSENAKHSVYEGIDGEETIGLQKINGNYDTSNPTLTYTYYAIDKNMYYCAKYTVDGNMTKIIDVKPLFEVGGTMNGYTLEDLMKYNLWYDYSNSGYNGNAVKYVGYGNAINSKSGEANLVMESFEGATRQISIAHIKGGGITLTTDSVKTYSSNVFVMRVSQVDYDTMKAAGTLDVNTLYVIAEVTE